MAINELLLNEFDSECANTKKTIERVPEAKWDWKPHSKSGSIGWLAGHVATLPRFAVVAINSTEFEIEGGDNPKVTQFAELLPAFEKYRKEAREAIAKVTDEELKVIWTLKWKGQTLFAMPRYAVVRSFCFNHIIHHRAQLTMYLRALDIPVPALYGPSADEQM